MKNYLSHVLALVTCTILSLLGMYHLPELKLGDLSLRKVDLLSDVRSYDEEPEEHEEILDSILPPLPQEKPLFIDTCKQGLTCIEDYSDSTSRGMIHFYKAFKKIKENKTVRIAVFGDSFIEADIFTSDLREMFQKKFGGKGVGYVDITSITYGYRRSVRQAFRGWKSHAITDTSYFDRKKQGVSSRYFIPTRNAYVQLKGQRKYGNYLDTCYNASIYFQNNDTLKLEALINNQKKQEFTVKPNAKLQKITVKDKIGRVKWTVKKGNKSVFYGLTMDGNKGVVVDNFSLRGASGLTLRYLPIKFLKQFNSLRSYDLIILQYGLNVATRRGVRYDGYKRGMIKAIEHLKKGFPNASILLMSVGDREGRSKDGSMKTMLGVKNLIRYQQSIAAESNIAFWNLYKAMGGEGSMRKLVESKPPKANRDYTHINFRGGKHLAKILFETLSYGKEQYDRKIEYEKN